MAAEIIPLGAYPGASIDEWTHLDLVLGLTEDLLPVVSNTKARVSPRSNIKEVGKVPSLYNGERQVHGFSDWTRHVTTGADVIRWSRERDYGACVQTRRVRAGDVDIPDVEESAAVREFIAERFDFPIRSRANSAKFLFAFELPGGFTKRRMKTAKGVIEFLATGQQFIAVGRHPSGVRYAWEGGLPNAFPVLTAEQFESLWADLAAAFAVEDVIKRPASVKAAKLGAVHENDPLAKHLHDASMVKRVERDGRLHIVCPWESEHTTDSGDSATTYWPAHTGGFEQGGFQCLHAHCEHRTVADLKDALGVGDDILCDFEVLAGDAADGNAKDVKGEDMPVRFRVLDEDQFLDSPPVRWLIKYILAQAEIALMFGDSGSGKSFMALDLAVSIALGIDWRGHKTTQGRVIYVAAEGAAGFRKRLKAYRQAHGVATTGVQVIAGAPNLLEKADAIDVTKAILARGKADLVIIDTLAQSMPGGNENSGEDVGRVLAHCKGIHRATGAMVLLVHHSGKDNTKGARGWSGLRAAVDAELEVMRSGDDRVMTVTKQKDGEDGAQFGFKLETVMIDFDDDGDDVTSCVVRHCDAANGVSDRRRAKPLGDVEKVVLQALEDSINPGDDVVPEARIALAAKEMINPPEQGNRDTRMQRIGRAIDSLIAGGRMRREEGGLAIGGAR